MACGFSVGLAKNGLPGMGTPAVVALAMIMPAKESVGFLLPILIVGDVCALAYYRRHAVRSILVKLMPWAAAGIVGGYFLLGMVDDRALKITIGAIVIVLFAVDWFRERYKAEESVPTQWWFAAIIGILAGVTTTLANAAGPLIIIYFAAMRVTKEEFMGTGGWYFFLLNSLKVPFFVHRDMITTDSFLTGMTAIPAVVLGAVVGILVLRRIPQKGFAIFAKAVAVVLAVKLLVWP